MATYSVSNVTFSLNGNDVPLPKPFDSRVIERKDCIAPLVASTTGSFTVTLSHRQYAQLMLRFGMWTIRDYIEWFYPQAKNAHRN